jgi:signal transduction histidine kinase
MVVQSDGRVIGTLEAGYRRTSYRRYIYEQDVRILRSILDYAVQALDQRDKRMLETFSHEFRAPLVGLRNNIDFLQRRRRQLQEELIDRKFDDMSLDCEILLQQVETLEYFLGRRPQTSRLEYTLVVRDIIIKMINQLKPLIAERSFDARRIELRPYESGMIRLNVDRAKLSRVFYNLLINAIKYAEADPKDFAIRIALDQNKDYYIISIKDWGIGVETGMEEKIFEEGFRTPRAVSRSLIGTGLGLTIARTIMRDMGGDLILANGSKPTEFHVHLPKNVRGLK